MAKILGVKTLLQKKFKYLDPLPPEIKASFGNLVYNFVMIVWGQSGNGKSNFLMQFLKVLVQFGKVLYISLEEGHEASMVEMVRRHLADEGIDGNIQFADHEMTYDKLVAVLKRKKSARFVFIDSLQYWNIDYERYKALKEMFPSKSFIFISHAEGKLPLGSSAKAIRYDAGIKVNVEGYVAKITSRYGGNKPFVIWEQGAKKYWGKQYGSVVSGVPDTKEKKNRAKKPKEETAATEAVISEPNTINEYA